MRRPSLAIVLAALAACGPGVSGGGGAPPPAAAAAVAPALPPGADGAEARLATSPRHAEWAVIPWGDGDSIRAWVVYPERAERAPVVVVVHEIYGLTRWVRAVADQVAADGYVAIAPDFLTGAGVAAGPDGDPERDAAAAAVRALSPDAVHARLQGVAAYGTALPAALPTYGIVGYCWGGAVAFYHAARSPERLGASVAFYGSSPDTALLGGVRVPVLGLYGENDARVNATIAPADSAMRALGKTFEPHVFPGAGHGFLRQQEGQQGANLAAARAAWPLTLRWFRTHLGG